MVLYATKINSLAVKGSEFFKLEPFNIERVWNCGSL